VGLETNRGQEVVLMLQRLTDPITPPSTCRATPTVVPASRTQWWHRSDSTSGGPSLLASAIQYWRYGSPSLR
jgi:hypothetical protein